MLTFYVHNFMFEKKNDSGEQSIFPRDLPVIPEFTIVDVRVMTSNNDSEGGYGCKLQRISLHHTSLYSYMGPESLHLLPESYRSAGDLAVTRAADNLFIHKLMEGQNVAFYAHAPAKAFISSVPVTEGYYRMVGPNGSELFPGVPCVDIAKADLIKYANVLEGEDDVTQAITLFDFASCVSALGVYVVAAQGGFTKSKDPALGDFRGVPLVDVDQFLKCVDFEGGVTATDGKVVFSFGSEIAGVGENPLVTVLTAPVKDVPGAIAPCPDFSLLVSEGLAVGKGYVVQIGTEELQDIVQVVLNVMGCMSSASGTPVRLDYASLTAKRLEKKRKTLTVGEGSGDEESGSASP